MNDEARDRNAKENDVIGNLGSPKLPFDYMQREHGTVPMDGERAPFQWLSEVAYKNVHRIVARGYDTTELMEQGYGMTDMLFVNFQARIATVEEDRMLNYVMILALEDGLSLPALMSRMVARSKTFLTQAAGTSILAFGHAYAAFSAFGNMVLEKMQQAEASGQSVDAAARSWWRSTSTIPRSGSRISTWRIRPRGACWRGRRSSAWRDRTSPSWKRWRKPPRNSATHPLTWICWVRWPRR